MTTTETTQLMGMIERLFERSVKMSAYLRHTTSCTYDQDKLCQCGMKNAFTDWMFTAVHAKGMLDKAALIKDLLNEENYEAKDWDDDSEAWRMAENDIDAPF